MSLLSVQGLHVEFESERGQVHAVRGVDFELERGRTLCLVGESGSGKSATASAVIGLLPPAGRATGTVRFDGTDLLTLSDQQLSGFRGNRIGMVFQDPLSALTPMFSIGRQLSDAIRVHRTVSKRQARREAVELLDLVGIRDPARRADAFPHQFSGGMRQRVVIALAIANQPDLLIADEPTTALDVTVQAQILDLLRVAREETGAGMLLITHDLGVVAGHADDVGVMYAGRIVERAGVEELFAAPRMPYTIGLLSSMPTVDVSDRRPLVSIPGEPPQLTISPAGCAFADRCPVVQAACRRDEPPLEAVTGGHLAACLRAQEVAAGHLDPAAAFAAVRPTLPPRVSPPAGEQTGSAVLSVRGLVKTFPVTKGTFLRRTVGHNTAVRGVDLDLHRGETLGLVGESGSGKTTTLLQIMQLRPPERGEITVLGSRVGDAFTRADRKRIRGAVQLVMQDPLGALDPRMPVYELIAEPLQAAGLPKSEIDSRVREMLALVGLSGTDADKFPAAFSGGQRQRIGIARALASRPEVVILDEPVSALDVSVQADILNLLAALQRRLQVSYLVVAHDLAVVRHLSDRVAVMYLGRIVETGGVTDIFTDARHPYTKALLSASPIPDPGVERARERIILTGDATDDLANEAIDSGCVFRTRCPLYQELPAAQRRRCHSEQPLAAVDRPDASAHQVACHVTATGT